MVCNFKLPERTHDGMVRGTGRLLLENKHIAQEARISKEPAVVRARHGRNYSAGT